MTSSLSALRSKADSLYQEKLARSSITQSLPNPAKTAPNFGIKIAILKDRSPSCGSRTIHDGSFKNNMIEGLGLTARALIADGIKVYADTDALDFLVPEEKKKKGMQKSKHVAKRPFAKKEEGEKKPFKKAKSPAKRTFKKKEDSFKEGKPARKSFGGKKAFSKKPYGKPRRSSNKPFNQKTPK